MCQITGANNKVHNDKKKVECSERKWQELDKLIIKGASKIEFVPINNSRKKQEYNVKDIMQHYSVNTNFFDWSEDAFTSMYFALEKLINGEQTSVEADPVIYIFSPNLSTRYNQDNYDMFLLGNLNLVYHLYAEPTREGSYSYLGLSEIQDYYMKLDNVPQHEPFLCKIVINKRNARDIALSFKALGLSKAEYIQS